MFVKNKHLPLVKWANEHNMNHNSLEIDSNRFLKIFEKLEQFHWDDNENAEYILNITGGNKIMAQAMYTYVIQRFKNVEVHYLPFNSRIIQKIYPEVGEIELPVRTRFSVSEYLSLFDFKSIPDSTPLRPFEKSLGIMKKIAQRQSVDAEPLINKYNKPSVSHPDKVYYTGKWFEEWIYYELKKTLNLDDEFIMSNLKLKKLDSNNPTESDLEIDVFLIYNDMPVWIECKVFPGGIKGSKLKEPFYKLSSLANGFGKEANTFILFCGKLTDKEKQLPRIKDLTETCKIDGVFFLEDFKSDVMNPINRIVETIKSSIKE
jgi:hypothetical protein